MAKRTQQLTNIRESADGELKERIKRLEEELFQNRLKRHTNQLENTNVLREARREIARAKTILSQRKHGGEKQAPKTEVQE